jgi:hypothetical protein
MGVDGAHPWTASRYEYNFGGNLCNDSQLQLSTSSINFEGTEATLFLLDEGVVSTVRVCSIGGCGINYKPIDILKRKTPFYAMQNIIEAEIPLP